ncbi:hypothetical protein Trydic_g17148 [Trypoxylus dichotomus]
MSPGSRVANRWPLTTPCTLMNVGAINRYIMPRSNLDSKLRRSEYLQELAKEQMKYYVHFRCNEMKTEGDVFIAEVQQQEEVVSMKYYGHCLLLKNRKTKTKFLNCSKPTYPQHTITMPSE